MVQTFPSSIDKDISNWDLLLFGSGRSVSFHEYGLQEQELKQRQQK